MISVILGPDASLVREYTRARALKADPTGQETTRLDGKAVSLNDVLMAAASIGFFSTGRTVIVDDLIARHAKTGTKSIPPEWETLLKGVPSATSLILADPSVLAVPAALKKMLPADAEVVQGDPPRGRDLLAWIVDRARSTGGKIDQQTARLLASTLFPGGWERKGNNPAFDRPPDMELLGNEVDKLVIAAHPDSVSDREIKDLVSAGEQDQVFTFIDAASSGQIGRAVVELDRLLAAGEDPHKIWSQLCGTVELAAVMAAAGRRDPLDVGRELKLPNPSRMNAVSRGVRDQPREMPARAVAIVAESDRRMKTGELKSAEDALYATITALGLARSGSR